MPRCSEWIVVDGRAVQCPNEGLDTYKGRRVGMRAEGNGEPPAYSREKIPGPDSHAAASYLDLMPGAAYTSWAYNTRPMLTPDKGLVRWWKASCAELKRATKEDTKRNRTRNDPSYADRARGQENGATASLARR